VGKRNSHLLRSPLLISHQRMISAARRQSPMAGARMVLRDQRGMIDDQCTRKTSNPAHL